MSMGFMIAAASRRGDERTDDREMRRRDSRGRYMEGNDNSPYMEHDDPEMRRRRDSRGRYMEDENGPRMTYEGNYRRNESAYRPWPEPHIPPYLDDPDMNDSPSRMRDKNIVNIHDYQDKRLIGFGANDRPHGEGGTDMRQYGRRYDPDRMTMGQQHQRQQGIGMAKWAEDNEHLTLDEAEEWVQGMKGEDGKTGGRWPYHEIKQYAANFGIQGEEQIVEFYAVMNALYTDYCKVAKKHGVDKVDFWADLAKAFIHDKDAKSGKVKMYYECIAKHDE